MKFMLRPPVDRGENGALKESSGTPLLLRLLSSACAYTRSHPTGATAPRAHHLGKLGWLVDENDEGVGELVVPSLPPGVNSDPGESQEQRDGGKYRANPAHNRTRSRVVKIAITDIRAIANPMQLSTSTLNRFVHELCGNAKTHIWMRNRNASMNR